MRVAIWHGHPSLLRRRHSMKLASMRGRVRVPGASSVRPCAFLPHAFDRHPALRLLAREQGIAGRVHNRPPLFIFGRAGGGGVAGSCEEGGFGLDSGGEGGWVAVEAWEDLLEGGSSGGDCRGRTSGREAPYGC